MRAWAGKRALETFGSKKGEGLKMGLMRMMLMPYRMLMIALGVLRVLLMPLRMMKRMRMMKHMHGMKHTHGMRHMHMMWRSMMMMLMLAQLAMLLFIAVAIIASTVLPVLLFFAFWMKKWMKKNMCMGMHCRGMMRRCFRR